ncbi:TPR repeat-domain-containing protein [Scenedesmus sp. NREL 46B-D3]|nr:TPR repeat-domain-containing protein [Scenedesmus sp. NREL 46B-D3]
MGPGPRSAQTTSTKGGSEPPTATTGPVNLDMQDTKPVPDAPIRAAADNQAGSKGDQIPQQQRQKEQQQNEASSSTSTSSGSCCCGSTSTAAQPTPTQEHTADQQPQGQGQTSWLQVQEQQRRRWQQQQQQQSGAGLAARPGSADTSKAEAVRQQGNTLFRNGRLDEAAQRYTAALDHNPTSVPAFANRAAALLKLQQWQATADDCTTALELQRRAAAAAAAGTCGSRCSSAGLKRMRPCPASARRCWTTKRC